MGRRLVTYADRNLTSAGCDSGMRNVLYPMRFLLRMLSSRAGEPNTYSTVPGMCKKCAMPARSSRTRASVFPIDPASPQRKVYLKNQFEESNRDFFLARRLISSGSTFEQEIGYSR